jgi:cytidine deaminase
MKPADLAAAAAHARERAYAPYSNYRVGAALLTKSGVLIEGANVENASYGLTICAERAAVFAAVNAGFREFAAIAIATENGGAPCGACRQVLREFGLELTVHLVDATGRLRTTSLSALLPDSFGPEQLRT